MKKLYFLNGVRGSEGEISKNVPNEHITEGKSHK